MNKEMNMIAGKYEVDEILGNVLDEYGYLRKMRERTSTLWLDAMYVEKQADDKWKYIQSPANKHIRYDIVETGRDELDSYPYCVREWHEVGNNKWVHAGNGVFCKTLEDAHNRISAHEKSSIKISKLDENTREVKQEDGEIRLFIKKYDIWWPARKNEKGDIYPDLFAVGSNHEYLNKNFKRMLINLERKGLKEINLSHWSFIDMRFDKQLMKLMGFADKINFQNAYFCYSQFSSGQMKNADFSGASFDMTQTIDCTFHKCDFSKTIWHDPADGDMNWANAIMKSAFISCKFEDAQLNNTLSSKNKFFACNFYGANRAKQRASIRDKLSGYLQEVKSRNADRDVKQREDRQEER